MASRALQLVGEDTPLALDLPAELSFEQWEAEGRRLSQTSHALQWFIGDWWNAGHKFEDEARRDTAKRLFGYDYGTMRNFGSVAGRVPLSRRRDNLSFSHHAELVVLDDETKVAALERQVAEQGLSVKQLRQEVRNLRVVAGTDTVAAKAPKAAPEPELPIDLPPVPKNELHEAYARYVEAMESIQEYRELTHREADYLAIVLEALGEAHAERRPVPDDFRVIFVEQGRLACEPHYRASRITVDRWLLQSGKKGLIEERAAYVKYQRNQNKGHMPLHADDAQPENDMLLPVARLAAQHLRVSRWGGHRVSQCDSGGWYVGTVRKSSEELIVMAERVGFNRQHAAAEAEREGY